MGMVDLPASKVKLLHQTSEKSFALAIEIKKQIEMTLIKGLRVQTLMQKSFQKLLKSVILGKRLNRITKSLFLTPI